MKTFAIISSVIAGANSLQVSTKKHNDLEPISIDYEVEETATRVKVSSITVEPLHVRKAHWVHPENQWEDLVTQRKCEAAISQWNSCCQNEVAECQWNDVCQPCPWYLSVDDVACHLFAGSLCTAHQPTVQQMCSDPPQECDWPPQWLLWAM